MWLSAYISSEAIRLVCIRPSVYNTGPYNACVYILTCVIYPGSQLRATSLVLFLCSHFSGQRRLHGWLNVKSAPWPHLQLHWGQPSPRVVPLPHQSSQCPVLWDAGEMDLPGNHQRSIRVQKLKTAANMHYFSCFRSSIADLTAQLFQLHLDYFSLPL